MKFFSLSLACVSLVLLAGTSEASINMTVDYGVVGVYATNNYPSQASSDFYATFDINGWTLTATMGNSTASATYHWSNTGNTAVFEAVNELTLNGGQYAISMMHMGFTLNESATYLIEGRMVGTSISSAPSDLPELQTLFWGGSTYIEEYESSNLSSFDLSLDGTQQGSDYFNTGSLSGVIGPGSYEIYLFFRLYDNFPNPDGINDMAASGFTRLTLSTADAGAMPEPLSVMVWCGLIAATVISSGRRTRS